MQIIKATNDLARFCNEARKHEFVTVDTEFLRESTYWPILCLIQAATEDEAVIIDPLSDGIDLAPFFDLLADDSVTKVFHAARQDVEIFVKLAGEVPKNLFDTQIAASVCGYGDSVSYDNLVRAVTGEQIDKSSRFTDWSARPLTDKQLNYALADVTHLREIYKDLVSKINEQDRWEWVEDENKLLTSIETYVVDPQKAWRRLKMKVNRPRDLAALMVLAEWREKRAQKNDQPRGRILKDDAISELAMQRPSSPQKFDRLRAVPRGFGKSSAAGEIINILKDVEKIPKEELPDLPKRPNGPSPKGPIGDLLRVMLKAIAEREGVAPRILASSDDIDALVLNDNADIRALDGWRRNIFGDKALALKHGRMALAATTKGIVEVPVDLPEETD